MKLKKLFWYTLMYLLLTFLVYYFIYSVSVIFDYYLALPSLWKIVIGVAINLFVLCMEFLSAFYSIWIYYFIGSSSAYKEIRDENNAYLSKDPLPTVSIIIPGYKEAFRVLSKTLEGALKLDYPKDRYEIIMCDDSPPDFEPQLKEFCLANNIKYIKRPNRKGFKAGAINNALTTITSDFFGILDADHIPTPNFIRTCLSGFVSDDIMLVQGKPMFVNQENYTQRSSAFIHTQFFHIYQKSRATRDATLFTGTTGIFRTDLFKKFGGMTEDTLAEDTDTSFLLIAEGYKMRYIHEVCSHGLVPWTPIGMVNQIWRWSHGLTSTFLKRARTILFKRGKITNKIDMIGTTITPTIGVTMWFVNLILILLYFFGTPLGILFIRPVQYAIPLLLVAPTLISLATFVMGIIAWRREEKEDRMIQMRGLKGFGWTLIVFYLLMLTAQSFLVWSIVSSYLGIKKQFDQTIKFKPKTVGRFDEKIKYTIWSVALFLCSIPFYIACYQSIVTFNPLLGWFMIATLTLTVPIIITITYFRELDFLRGLAGTRTAADFTEQIEQEER